jgi:hypothetical protein
MKKIGMMMLLAVGLSVTGWVNSAGISEIAEQYGDWTVMNGEGPPYRYNALSTSTDGEGYLVYSCHVKDACYLTILITASCDVGESYPMLMNSDSGAVSVSTTCIDIHEEIGGAEYSFNDPDAALAETVFTDTRIAIAVPMADGKFQAVRFSLMGSQEAMARAIQLANSPKGKSVESGEF